MPRGLVIVVAVAIFVVVVWTTRGRREDEEVAVLRAVFGAEQVELFRGVKRALEALMQVLELRTNKLKHPVLVNLSLLALGEKPLLAKGTTCADVLAKARLYMPLATAAYGALTLVGLGLLDPRDAAVGDDDVAVAIASRSSVAVRRIVPARPGVPAHFVADDERGRLLVCVRGTRSVEDAVTDLVATAAAAPELGPSCRAHAGIRDAAKRLVEGLASEAKRREVVVLGHSLGGGVAALAAIDLASCAKSVECYCFAPPPVATADCEIPANCAVTAIVNAEDCVPTLSLRSVARLLLRAAHVDGLPLSPADRLAALHGSSESLEAALRDTPLPEEHDDDGLASLALVGDVYHLHDGRLVGRHKDEFARVRLHSRMLLDHLPHNYEHALASAA